MALLAIIATSFNTGILVVVGVDSFQVGVSWSPPTTAKIVVGRRRYESSIASSSLLRSCNINHIHNHNLRLQFPVTTSSPTTYLSASTSSSPNTTNKEDDEIDSLIVRTSNALRASSWFSWWSQVILTVISSITFIFARNVMTMPTTTAAAIGQAGVGPITIGKFFLPGLGIAASSLSIIWTWGQRRLARRFVRPRRRDGGGGRKSPSITGITTTTSRIEAANLLRSTIKFGVSLNLFGLLTSVLGAQYIVGTLVAKSMQSFVGLGGVGITSSQTLQPLDVLVVQANTNVLSSHFVSLVCLLWLTRMVDLLDPPSLEEEEEEDV